MDSYLEKLSADTSTEPTVSSAFLLWPSNGEYTLLFLAAKNDEASDLDVMFLKLGVHEEAGGASLLEDDCPFWNWEYNQGKNLESDVYPNFQAYLQDRQAAARDFIPVTEEAVTALEGYDGVKFVWKIKEPEDRDFIREIRKGNHGVPEFQELIRKAYLDTEISPYDVDMTAVLIPSRAEIALAAEYGITLPVMYTPLCIDSPLQSISADKLQNNLGLVAQDIISAIFNDSDGACCELGDNLADIHDGIKWMQDTSEVFPAPVTPEQREKHGQLRLDFGLGS